MQTICADIDFSQIIKEKEAEILAQFLKRQKSGRLLARTDKSPHIMYFDNALFKISLSHRILCRERHSTKNIVGKEKESGLRYEVLSNDLLVETSLNKIWPTVATIRLKNDEIEIKKDKPRIVKEDKRIHGKPVCLFPLREVNFGMLVPHLHMKPLIRSESNNYIVMRKISGKSLYELFKDNSIQQLSYPEKLALTHALLTALQEQVHAREWVHKDIKPENIMVDFAPGNTMPAVHIIDFGFCKLFTEEDKVISGTPAYMAPEVRKKKTGPASDIFAMGKVFSHMWKTGSGLPEMEQLINNMMLPADDQRMPLDALIARVIAIDEALLAGLLKLRQQIQLICIFSLSDTFISALPKAVFSSVKENWHALEEQEQYNTIEMKIINKDIQTLIESLEKLAEEDKIGAFRLYDVLIRCFQQTEKQNSNAELACLYQSIRKAIVYYIQETYTASTIKARNRAASENRINDINALLTILEKEHLAVPSLKEDLVAWKKTLKTGLWGNSKLASLVDKAAGLHSRCPSSPVRYLFWKPAGNFLQTDVPVSHECANKIAQRL
jgi:serine/threonine protein kinase